MGIALASDIVDKMQEKDVMIEKLISDKIILEEKVQKLRLKKDIFEQ